MTSFLAPREVLVAKALHKWQLQTIARVILGWEKKKKTQTRKLRNQPFLSLF